LILSGDLKFGDNSELVNLSIEVSKLLTSYRRAIGDSI